LSQTTMIGAPRCRCAAQEVAVVLPGEALACAFQERVEAGPVDHPGPLAGPVAAHRGDRDPASGASSNSDHGRVSASAPGAGAWRRHRESGLVLEDDPGPERRRGASTCGHTSFFHSSTACSSRSSARRDGLCEDQPCRCRSRQTPAIEQLTWNWRPIRVLTRSSVHRWSSQPCAAGPFASCASSRANRSSDSFGSFAGPFDCRPSRPRFSPVAAPLLDRTLAHPQGLGDVRRPVTALEPPAGFHPDPFPRSPPLGSQAAPVIRIPHDTGLP
jgi:hypothetical protein